MHQQTANSACCLGLPSCQRAVMLDHLKRPQDSKLDHRLLPRDQR